MLRVLIGETWPKSWPAELEPLRKQSRTFEGPTLPLLHHAIPFTKRDEFESAWPHLLKIKSKGAPIVLRRGPSFWLGDKATAGVCVHTPPAGEAPIADGKDAKGNWEETIYIELIVDGAIIDLNRIPLPADTPIIDERFEKNGPEKRAQQSKSAEDRVAHLEDQLKTLQKEIVGLREQRLNDQLLLQLSGTWHELNPKDGTKESVPAVTPNVWRLTAFGNCDRHAIGGDEALKTLRAELEEAREVWLTKYRQATSEIERTELEKQNAYRAFEPKFLEFVRTYSKERVAIDAVQWLATTANPGPVFDEALLLIERHHLQDNGVIRLCRTLVDRRSPGIERFMLAVATNNSNHDVQGVAYLSLARYLNQTHAMATYLRTADESLRAQLKRDYSEDIAAWMLTADPKKLSARIDGICKNIISDYGDVNDDEYADATGKRRTLADAAKALLFSLHAVGSVAPEMAGVGVDGTRVSLSDQRGKVVVLMFSANWCGPCKMMYGQLRELMKLYADKPFSVMTVMSDNELSTVSKAVDSGEIVWPVIWDGSKGVIANEWNITKYPTIYLIDRDGRIVSEDLRDDPLDDEVARLLGISAESRVKVDKRTRVWNVSIKDKKIRGDDVPKLLEGYAEMRNLDLSDNPISDEDLRHLLPFKKLATLHLEHTKVTDKGLQILKGLPNLKELHLSVNSSEGTTAAGRRALSNAIPGLRVLIVTH